MGRGCGLERGAVMSEKRDLAADLALYESIKDERYRIAVAYRDVYETNKRAEKYVSEAIKGFPYWINRAQQVEAENARLNHLLDESEKQRAEIMEGLREIDAERDQALAEAEVLREVLKELIDLKSIKDTMGKTPDYIVRKTRAWRQAKQAISSPAAKAYAERVQKLEAVVNTAKPAAMWMQSWLDEMLCELAALKDALAALEVPADGLRS